MLVKPKRLQAGSTVATISLSGGSAGEQDMHWRYEIAKERLKTQFELKVVETPHSQKGRDYIYRYPKARAEDFMEAMKDTHINAIFLNQGGDDGIRTLPFIDLDVIARNPKVFMGFSDGSVFTSMFQKANVVSFYGPNVLTTLSEPVELHDYTKKWLKKVLFSTEPIGSIEPAPEWTSEAIDWSSRTEMRRKMNPSDGYQVLQGKGKVSGRLVGGCSGPMQLMMGTSLWPESSYWTDSIIFIEGILPYGMELAALHTLRSFAAAGIFRKAAGIVFARSGGQTEECRQVILKVMEEQGLQDLPILMNIDCGHCAPMTVIPFGVEAEIDCGKTSFSIRDAAVQ
jgi:muramoyltetrapeptide carboxypeptidase LdcA involved in peptidoglycan recycling